MNRIEYTENMIGKSKTLFENNPDSANEIVDLVKGQEFQTEQEKADAIIKACYDHDNIRPELFLDKSFPLSEELLDTPEMQATFINRVELYQDGEALINELILHDEGDQLQNNQAVDLWKLSMKFNPDLIDKNAEFFVEQMELDQEQTNTFSFGEPSAQGVFYSDEFILPGMDVSNEKIDLIKPIQSVESLNDDIANDISNDKIKKELAEELDDENVALEDFDPEPVQEHKVEQSDSVEQDQPAQAVEQDNTNSVLETIESPTEPQAPQAAQDSKWSETPLFSQNSQSSSPIARVKGKNKTYSEAMKETLKELEKDFSKERNLFSLKTRVYDSASNSSILIQRHIGGGKSITAPSGTSAKGLALSLITAKGVFNYVPKPETDKDFDNVVESWKIAQEKGFDLNTIKLGKPPAMSQRYHDTLKEMQGVAFGFGNKIETPDNSFGFGAAKQDVVEEPIQSADESLDLFAGLDVDQDKPTSPKNDSNESKQDQDKPETESPKNDTKDSNPSSGVDDLGASDAENEVIEQIKNEVGDDAKVETPETPDFDPEFNPDVEPEKDLFHSMVDAVNGEKPTSLPDDDPDYQAIKELEKETQVSQHNPSNHQPNARNTNKVSNR